MNKWTKAGVMMLALTASNFLYQALTYTDWDTASERSFFQIIAVFYVVLFLHEKAA
jgi:hypothetical protein